MATRKTKQQADILKGWQAIAKFLGQSPAVVER